MGKGGAPAAGQGVHALAGHGDGLAGRQQHLGLVPAEGDDAHLVPRCVALLQQRQRRALYIQQNTHDKPAMIIQFSIGVGTGTLQQRCISTAMTALENTLGLVQGHKSGFY